MQQKIPDLPEWLKKTKLPYQDPFSLNLLNTMKENAGRGNLLTLDTVMELENCSGNLGAYTSVHQSALLENGVPVPVDYFLTHQCALLASTLLNADIAYVHTEGAEYGKMVTKNRQVLQQKLSSQSERLVCDDTNVLEAFFTKVHELNTLSFQAVCFHNDTAHPYIGATSVNVSKTSKDTLTSLSAVLAYKDYLGSRMRNELLALHITNEDNTRKRFITGFSDDVKKRLNHDFTKSEVYNQIDPGALVLFELDKSGMVIEGTPRSINVLRVVAVEPLGVLPA